jgi:hypothetical protein
MIKYEILYFIFKTMLNIYLQYLTYIRLHVFHM